MTEPSSKELLALAESVLDIESRAVDQLKSRLDEYALSIYQTAVQYQFYHSLALLGVGLFCLWQPQSRLLLASGIAFLAGILVFSGSLYLLSFTGIRWLGAITPIGGLALIAGWVLLMVTAWGLPELR